MPVHRILLALVQPLLALLLIAGTAQAELCLFEDRDRNGAVERSLSLTGDVMAPLDDYAVGLQTQANGDNDHDAGSVLPAVAPAIILDQARLIRMACVAYSTAPPTHRPCAAPPTGPPLV
ncbi:hypothetical protein [Microvirga lotononidis]|uniref:Uncharacterized protein n=1 Tax=Microvirga lotononidis TaxID=864069 RepID=I4YV53_9HYPH|nr:hypothetical protein [Microvirga lotononidis]EIM27845.1 hypothetical protein MicloDRAFT_00044190 [Microvirga lotononidis]WQO28025.1 hypothetical protein U0023_02660 [Microvirga lotononidis]